VTVNAATLFIGANNQSVARFTLTGEGALSGDTGVLSAGSFDLYSGSVSAILGGTGTLSKNSTGVVTLSGANTLSGIANINAGTLVLAGSSTSSGTLFAANGALLTGTGTTTAQVKLASGGLLSPGSASATGKLTLGGLTLTGGANLNFRLSTLANSDQIALTNSNGLSLTNNNTITLSLATGVSAPVLGTYKLISYSGTQATSGLSLSSNILTRRHRGL
jgi:autotransporter-associated beta strand protein